MRLAFFLDNRGFAAKGPLADPRLGNPGIGGTEFAFLASIALLAADPDACTPSLEVADLRVTKGLPGRVLLSWSASSDPCHQSAPGEPAYAVYAAPMADGADDPAPFPAGTAFVEVTPGDLDGNYCNERHERLAPPGSRYYLVADIGRAGVRGPVGHYGR